MVDASSSMLYAGMETATTVAIAVPSMPSSFTHAFKEPHTCHPQPLGGQHEQYANL